MTETDLINRPGAHVSLVQDGTFTAIRFYEPRLPGGFSPDAYDEINIDPLVGVGTLQTIATAIAEAILAGL